MKPVRAVGIQYAALPYRITDGRLEVLLLTSRGTGRWVIPKGWPMRGKSPQEAAAVEAHEEAGVEGEVAAASIGSYRYLKRLNDGRRIPVQVIVFPLQVTAEMDQWKEQTERRKLWMPYMSAARSVGEPGLKRLLREWGRSSTPGLLGSAARLYTLFSRFRGRSR